jgi:accessory gene regulator B
MEKQARKVVQAMNFIDRSAEFIAQSIRRNYDKAGSEAVLKYSLNLVINTLTAIVVAFLFCTFTGHLYQFLIAFISFIAIRFVTGGMHMSSSLACCIMTATIFVIASLTDFNYNKAFLILDSISIVIFLITVPNDIQGLSSLDSKYYPLLKLIAVLIVSSNFIIHSTVLTASFIIQAFLTTPIAYKARDLLERRCL